MALLSLLLIPIAISLVGFFVGKGRITGKEFAVQFGAIVLIVTTGYFIGRLGVTADTELWNGTVARKDAGTEGCCHSYPCHPHSCMCDSKGSCSTCWDTCYEHSHDQWWNATSTNNERIFYDGCNSPGTQAPERWNQIKIGEPTTFPHDYKNYIKAAPNSILRHHGAVEHFKGLIPQYPRVYDHYRTNRFLFVGVQGYNPEQVTLWNQRLSEINGDLGARKQINIIVVVVGTADRGYLYALEEAWLGGKKNDVVVIVGSSSFPKIDWVEVMSWTKAEMMKIMVRDRIETLGNFDGDKMLSIVAEETAGRFIRRPMADFDYLAKSITPSFGVLVFLLILGIVVCGGLEYYFWMNDPFDYGYSRFDRTRDRY